MKQTEQTDKSTQKARIRREQVVNRIIDNLGWDAMLRITKLAKQNKAKQEQMKCQLSSSQQQ